MDERPKRRRALNLAEKIAVIEQSEKSRSPREIAQIFGCSCQTILSILKHKNEYLEDWANNADPRRVRYRPNFRFRALQYVVFEWVQRCRFYPMRITDQLIRQTGEDVAILLGVAELHQMTGWVGRFKDKFKLNNYDLMNTERPEVAQSSFSQKKSLGVESIIAEMRQTYGNAVVPESSTIIKLSDYSHEVSNDFCNNKRLKLTLPDNRDPFSSYLPSVSTYDNNSSGNIETIDLTESIHSGSDNEDTPDDVIFIDQKSIKVNEPHDYYLATH